MAEIIELNLKEEEVKKIKTFFKSNAVKVERQSVWSYIIMVGEVIYYNEKIAKVSCKFICGQNRLFLVLYCIHTHYNIV